MVCLILHTPSRENAGTNIIRMFPGSIPAGLQVKECSRLALDAVRDGMCVVIGLQSTGEANMTSERAAKGDELDDFVSVHPQPWHSICASHVPS